MDNWIENYKPKKDKRDYNEAARMREKQVSVFLNCYELKCIADIRRALGANDGRHGSTASGAIRFALIETAKRMNGAGAQRGAAGPQEGAP